MKRIVYTCDRCGKETEKAYTVQIVDESENTVLKETGTEEKDFCEECMSRIVKSICAVNPPKKVKAEKPQLDTQKIQALWDAGWTLHKIADEFGVEVADIKEVMKTLEPRKKTRQKPLEKWCIGEGDEVMTQGHFESASIILQD